MVLAGSLYLFAKPHPLPAPPAPAPQAQAPAPVPQATGPTITWSVPQLTQTMFPGTSSTVTVSFHSDQNVTGVIVDVTSSLDGIVSANPASFAAITANQPYQITLTVSAPPEFIKRSFVGAIQLRNADQVPYVYGSPLKIGVRIDFVTYTDQAFTINVPTDLIPADEPLPADDPTNPIRLVSFSLPTDPIPVLYVYLYPHGFDIMAQSDEPPKLLGTNSQFDFYFQMRSAPADPAALAPSGLTPVALEQELLQAIATFKMR